MYACVSVLCVWHDAQCRIIKLPLFRLPVGRVLLFLVANKLYAPLLTFSCVVKFRRLLPVLLAILLTALATVTINDVEGADNDAVDKADEHEDETAADIDDDNKLALDVLELLTV